MWRLVLALVILSAELAAAQHASGPAAAASPSANKDAERDLLLTFKAGITNWDEAAADRGLVGWCDADTPGCLPVCAWSGVECSPDGRNSVVSLHLECVGTCTVPLQGSLRPGLHRLPSLETLHLHNNNLSGSLPPQWGEPGSFPALVELDLNDNQLEGAVLPDSWSIGPAFNQLLDVQLARNQFSGPFPETFALTNTSFKALMVLNVAGNQLSGPLPSYVNGMTTMSLVGLQENRFTGTLPPDWGVQVFLVDGGVNATQAMEKLYLHGNRLTGTVPAQWAQPGSFQVLKHLTLSENRGISGGLPLEWGQASQGGALAQLRQLEAANTSLSGPLPAWGAGLQGLSTLDVAGNLLTGSIPASWGQLASLRSVYIAPGNPSFCVDSTPAEYELCRKPAGASGGCIPVTPVDYQCSDGGSSGSESSSESSSSGGSSFPYAAVVVPVAVLCGAALMVAGFLLGRRRLRLKTGAADGPDKDLEAHPSSIGAPGPLSPFEVTLVDELAGAGDSGGSKGSGDSGAKASLSVSRSGRHGSNAFLPSAARTASLEMLEDWRIDPSEIEIVRKPDGSLHRLGAGGWGTVYKALVHGVQPVAVKVVRASSGSMDRPMTEADFQREIAILQACRDSHVLQFQGACRQEDGRLLLVTEYMDGGNLVHNLQARRVTWWRHGKKVALDVARALVYLHARRIVHLDLKSANVLLTKDGTAKVGDVGMARIMHCDRDYVSGAVGTLAWSAPELLLGEHCTTKADIYSFGVLLWEIATGELPKRGQLREPMVPVDCPYEVVALIHRCCASKPEARPTAVQLVQLLQQAPTTPSDSVCGTSGAGESRIFAPVSVAGSGTNSGPNSGDEPWPGFKSTAGQQQGGAPIVDAPPQLSAVREESSGTVPLVSPFASVAAQQDAAPQQAPQPARQQAPGSSGTYAPVSLRLPRTAVQAPASPFVSPFAGGAPFDRPPQ